MKHALHHYTWLLHRFWPALVFYSSLWLIVFAVVWASTRWFNSDDLALSAHVWLPLPGGFLLLRALLEDRATGTTSFWRTRPPRWLSLWASQFLFLLTIAAPPLLCWFGNGLLLDNSLAQWSSTSWVTALILCPLLALAGIASLSRGWYSLCLCIVAFSLCWLAGLLMLRSLRPGFVFYPSVLQHLLPILLLILPSLACTIVWMAGMKSGGSARRAASLAVMLVLFLIGGPWLFSYAVIHLDNDPVPVLELKLAPSSPAPRPGAQSCCGDWELSGVPAGCVAITARSSLRFLPPGASPPAPLSGMPFQYWGKTFHTLPSLAPVVPANTRWYHVGPIRAEEDVIHFPASPQTPLTLMGMLRGWIVRPVVEMDLPLSEGTTSLNGLRVRLRGVRLTENKRTVYLAADVWRTSATLHLLRGDGTSEDSFHPDPLVPVLYFPAQSVAILLETREDRTLFRSWQTNALSWGLECPLPLAETIRGMRWDTATLQSARLLFCRLRIEGRFIAPAEEMPPKMPAPNDAGEIEKLIEAWYSYEQQNRRRANETALLALGQPALRRLMDTSWARPDFPHFAGALFASAPPGLLAEAALRDQRWLSAALHAGLTAQATEVSLQLLRKHPGQINADALTAAASAVTPADYSALQRQLGMHRFDIGSITLWEALRRLPGFDWKTPARIVWLKWIHMPALPAVSRGGLRLSAALAGEASALTGHYVVMIPKAAEDSPLQSLPEDTPGVQDLADLVEGLPSALADRSLWLERHRQVLFWDDSLQHFRVQK